jgi:hypothetical protein
MEGELEKRKEERERNKREKRSSKIKDNVAYLTFNRPA